VVMSAPRNDELQLHRMIAHIEDIPNEADRCRLLAFTSQEASNIRRYCVLSADHLVT